MSDDIFRCKVSYYKILNGEYFMMNKKELINETKPLIETTVTANREQTNSLYLLIHNSIKINPGKEALKKAINKLDGLHTYYMLLEAPGQGSYLQVAGGSGEYTVEIRKQTNEEHCHYRAETKSGNSGERKILYGGGELTLQTCQVLSIDQVYETACKYLVTQEPHGDYIWKELIL